MKYRDKETLKELYSRYGSTRKVGEVLAVSSSAIHYWMGKFGLPRNPKLHLGDSNTARNRRGWLWILHHPFFRTAINDRVKSDVVWKGEKCDVKTSHHHPPTFRIKRKRHKVGFYFCLSYGNTENPLIPTEVWVIPSSVAPHSTIKPGLVRETSKYHKYKLSLLRNKEFSSEAEAEYNKQFVKKYKHCLSEGDWHPDRLKKKLPSGRHIWVPPDIQDLFAIKSKPKSF